MISTERSNSAIINGLRRKCIVAGSSTTVQEVNNLLKQHTQVSKMMKSVSSGGGMEKMQQRLMSQIGGMQRFVR